ncbi:MAG: ester cyclase [Pseudomonadota bacterium]
MTLSIQGLIERFYHDLWNQADESVASEILHLDFRFRGSLGPEKRGRAGFIDYMRSVHRALGNYTCTIEDIVATDRRAAARMTFQGIHRADFFGVPATGQEIQWAGAAFFQSDGQVLTALWVLGDIDAVKHQLRAGAAEGFSGE